MIMCRPVLTDRKMAKGVCGQWLLGRCDFFCHTWPHATLTKWNQVQREKKMDRFYLDRSRMDASWFNNVLLRDIKLEVFCLKIGTFSLGHISKSCQANLWWIIHWFLVSIQIDSIFTLYSWLIRRRFKKTAFSTDHRIAIRERFWDRRDEANPSQQKSFWQDACASRDLNYCARGPAPGTITLINDF